MAYDDDEDLYGEEFDFVDDDDDTPTEASDADAEEKSESKPPRKGASSQGRPPSRSRGGAKGPTGGARRPPRRDDDRRGDERVPDEPAAAPESAADRDYGDRLPGFEDEPAEERAPDPTGPPADHVIHIYEFGKFKRTIPRKFTDEEAVNFAEEYTRTGKSYGRYAIATPDDEEPAAEFADAAKG